MFREQDGGGVGGRGVQVIQVYYLQTQKYMQNTS